MKDKHGDEAVPIQTFDQFRGGCIKKEFAEEAFKEYQFMNHNNQTFERLHERGGFSAEEMIWLLFRRCRRLSGD